MNGYALKKPALRCSFTAANGTVPTAYPWTGVGEIRPKIDGVDQQFVVGGSNIWDLNSNQIQNRVSAATLVGIKLASRARRITLGMENDETGVVGTFMGILLRGADNLSTYLTAVLNRTVGGSINLRVQTEVGVDLGSVTFTPSPVITTRQQAEVIDTGIAIIFSFAGARLTVPTTTYNTQQSVGLVIPTASASALQKMDNLEAWI